jgi:hypothetical protein
MLNSLLLIALLPKAQAESVKDAYPPPTGSQRVTPDAFGEWLQERTLRAVDTPIRTHDGRIVYHNGRPLEMGIVRGDLQQCADSVIRLRAEWLREIGRVNDLAFFATSGDPLPWQRYAGGEKPVAINNKIEWRSTTRTQSWDGWLQAVFTWAGTRSLAAYETRPVSDPQPGDMLVQPGSPGHAVVIFDVAKADDQTWLLVGEGFMPAQDFHIEHGPVGGWYAWGPNGTRLSHWKMEKDSLRRWK